MDTLVPAYVASIAKTFLDNKFQIYLVGGSVRNLLLSQPVKDWDLTTNATPEEIQGLFSETFYDNAFGTVGIPIPISPVNDTPLPLGESRGEGEDSIAALQNDKKKHVVEITTFRTESAYTDRRHPESVSWGKTIEEDLTRRDFTMNAIALDMSSLPSALNVNTDTTQINFIDPFNGQEDIKNKIIRTVGNPQERFKEDALRLMRAVRFASQLGFTIETKTMDAIIEDASLLSHIAFERIRDELIKILASYYPHEGIMLLRNTNLLDYILPELLEGVGVSQERPGRHHTTDVFTHNVDALKHCPSEDPIVRFATLIHDIGKPRVEGKDEDGYVIFYNHEVAGAQMASVICDRLRFSKKDKQTVVTLIRWHMFTIDEHITDASIRRFIRRIGVDNVKDMIDLRIGDRLGSGTQRAESWRLKLFRERLEKELGPKPFSINDLAIDGNDIMKELQIKPSRKIGEILQKLFEEVDEDMERNTKEYLLHRIRELNDGNA